MHMDIKMGTIDIGDDWGGGRVEDESSESPYWVILFFNLWKVSSSKYGTFKYFIIVQKYILILVKFIICFSGLDV